jgi:hypothetical protein
MVAFPELSDQRFGAAAERSAIEILASDRPVQMWRINWNVRLIEAGVSVRSSFCRWTLRGFFRSAMKSSMSAVRMSAIGRSPKCAIRGLRH